MAVDQTVMSAVTVLEVTGSRHGINVKFVRHPCAFIHVLKNTTFSLYHSPSSQDQYYTTISIKSTPFVMYSCMTVHAHVHALFLLILSLSHLLSVY